MDVHVPLSVTMQLRRRSLDVLTAQDDDATRLTDDDLLVRATVLGRILVTQDIRFRVLAEERQRAGGAFVGLIYGHQSLSIGSLVKDLDLIANCLNAEEIANRVIHLPL